MGGGSYDMDVAHSSRAQNTDAFSYEGYGYGADRATARRSAHPELDPKGVTRECNNELPIVVALDVTRSRGDDTKLMYEKLPMFIGQLELQGYVPGAAISFAAIGDATSDEAPLQVGQFEADNRLDAVLQKFWIEEGGGGTGQESYELAAYFYARHVRLAAYEKGEKGFFFFVGDEGFYPQVDLEQVKTVLGHQENAPISSAQIFAELRQKFHVFFVYPKSSWRARKDNIDAEIRQRVIAAGGQYDDVDVRASLIWHNRNDLDLHVVAPSGERISFASKRSRCGGWLDVDMNVRGETLKPVENIRWAKGQAPVGKYQVRLQNYAFHETKKGPVPYEIEVEIAGQLKSFKGVISPNGQTGASSELLIHEFDYAPDMQTEQHADAYAQYDDAVIRGQWAQVIGEENILEIEEPEAIIEVMLGAMAITQGSLDLDGVVAGMRQRAQSEGRREMVRHALGALHTAQALQRSSVQGTLPDAGDAPSRKSATKRL